jgi:hypothetical protein
MNFDELSEEWRATNEVAATVEQREQLIATTCRRVERFSGQIFRRDIIETAAAVFVIVAFGFMQLRTDFSTLERIGAGVIVVGAACIIDCLQPARRSTPRAPFEAPLRDYCYTELARVEKQIKLLQNVVVWYLGPIMLGLVLMSFGRHRLAMPFFADLAIYAAIAWGIYALNQRAARKQLIPHRDQLRTLRARLDLAEYENGEHATINDPESANEPRKLWRWLFYAGLCSVAIALNWEKVKDYPKKSPFTAVRWQESQPEVRVGEEWFKLVSLNELPASKIVAFSRWNYGDSTWRKRFEEDLVEVLTRMGHEPKDTVRLVVSPLNSSTEQTLEGVAMTEANRQAIKAAAIARERAEQ